MKLRLSLLPAFLVMLLFAFGACKKGTDAEPATNYIARDETLITDYIKANNLTGFVRDSVVYVGITKPGTGPLAKIGQTLIVKYTGTTLDGKVFDQTKETTIGFPFVLRDVFDPQLDVIKGWAIGFRNLNKGSQATLLIPSELAYGGTATGSIPAHAVLRFDVEVINIK